MKILIIEDEMPTAKDLARTIGIVDNAIEIIGILSSVADIEHNYQLIGKANLIFSDIQLSDGLSLDALVKFNAFVPIIFCTAYNHYALQAFKANGIDYLLKPFSFEMVKNALEKFKRLTQPQSANLVQLADDMKLEKHPNSANIIVYEADRIVPIPIKAIALFYIANGIVYALSFEGNKKHITEQLDSLEIIVGNSFFRTSRQTLVNRKAIKDASKYFDRKILVNLNINFTEQILVSRLKTAEFIAWLSAV